MTVLQQRMLKRLSSVPVMATMCPGRLARDCGSELKTARADLLLLAQAGKVVLSQGGEAVLSSTLKGPFRVRLKK